MKVAPSVLGRGLVVRAGSEVDASWPRIRVDSAALREPTLVVTKLYLHWLQRRPVVVELAVSNEALRQPQVETRAAYELPHDFEFSQERLHFLVWANNADATRQEEPIWWYDRMAAKLGLKEECWCDGGPRDKLSLPVLHRETLKLGRVTSRPCQSIELDRLTPRQREAVTHPGGPARVIAPAGSGKTRVLTTRLRYLVQERGVEPELVTTVAYNVRAMKEMRERTEDLGERLQIRTVHSLGLAILRELKNPRVLKEGEVRRLLEPILPPAAPVLNQDRIGPYLEALARVRLALVEPREVEREREDVPEFSRVFETYQNRLEERNLVDYDQMVYGAIEALCRNPGLRKAWQARCQHLLVDEFQDLTPAFLILLRLLSAPAYQVFGVGDDDQVIYGYAGATPDYLVDFESLFPGARLYDLGTNFRCPKPVVDSARYLLAKNRVRVAKTIEACEGAPEAGLEVHSVKPRLEAQAVVSLVEEFLEGGLEPDQIAVLARVNSVLLPVRVLLHKAGIPHLCSLSQSLLERTGIRTALAYLHLADSPEDFHPADLRECLRRPSRRIRRTRLDELTRVRSLDGLSRRSSKFEDWEEEIFAQFIWDIQSLAKTLRGQGVGAALRYVRTSIGLGVEMDALDRSAGKNVSSGHVDDLLALEQAAGQASDVTEFEQALVTALESEARSGVCLSSIHRVKGREWPGVIVFGARQGLMPHRLAAKSELEEERRVFHVALTRTSGRVVILADKKNPSPFIRELSPPPPPLAPGQTVVHKTFGEGEIVRLKKGVATVQFREGPRRKVKASFLSPV